MLDKKTLSLIDTASTLLGLHVSMIEKDYFVTKGIHLLSQTDNGYFQLVFCGGTALAKAHKIIHRMSEDIDFKIQVKNDALSLSKSQFLKELKKFRGEILALLEKTDLEVRSTTVRNEGRYLCVNLDYPSVFPTNTGLRPHILLEFTLSNARLPIENKVVRTLIEETLKNVALFDQLLIPSISVEETAAEKWVALTRKISAIERGHYPDDPTLVRHIYDLISIQQADSIKEQFFTLVPVVVHQDTKQFKSQHPEYAADPLSEIQRSLSILKTHPHWQERYQAFKESMIYSQSIAPSYQEALEKIEALSITVMGLIQQSQ